jgi:general nucleoside transport system ATP-binding protein
VASCTFIFMEIQLLDIHKRFGTVRANQGVSLTVAPGTIHGILGENGAGKSTLMKILAGYIQKSSGTIRVDGRRADYRSPARAVTLGIGMLYQDPLDFPSLSILDNFILGQGRGLGWDRKKALEKFSRLNRSTGFNLKPDPPVRALTVGERQQLEILRLLSLGIRTLILDEPTTGISAVQKEALFQALKMLTRLGKSVILVSHKIEDVQTWCDAVTVLRCGRVSGHQARPFDTEAVLEMMFDTLPCQPVRCRQPAGETVLAMETVSARGGRTGLRGCDVTIGKGEIVGLAGLEGSGQAVFLRLAAGLKRPLAGKVCLNGEWMQTKGYHSFRNRGVAFLPADRLEEGLVPGLSIVEHWALRKKPGRFLVDWKRSGEWARQAIDTFRVVGTPGTRVESLSGGNQQRLLLSFLPVAPRLLLLENPTRGLDQASAAWIWNHLQQLREKGAGIVFSSSELDEILAVADRVLVFFNGRILVDSSADAIDAAQLGRAIAGKPTGGRGLS